jgi:hypothetical protein
MLYLYLGYEGSFGATHEHPNNTDAYEDWADWAFACSSAEAKLYRLPERAGNLTIIASMADQELAVAPDSGICDCGEIETERAGQGPAQHQFACPAGQETE